MIKNLLGIIGWSGSGKTTLLEFLIGQLTAAGQRVNVVKHSHHDIIIEPPQKDSARFRTAGAAEVMLVSPYRYVITRELHAEPEPALQTLLARFSAADILLIEGYKWEPISKLEVHRPALGKPPLYPDDPCVIAVASDMPAPPGLRDGIAWLDLNRPDEILEWLLIVMRDGKIQKKEYPG
ncbi:molybdopterin-guanine dinucleotide biosynthesis protein B [Undibacterium griseum]|uniref:Molybdopterin-guanine dinucleotide biosynthesis protein B n=1 Tax=Undibacterium griseum TaxID=2762295 RepID=A0ABR6YRB0_9BURK|nr:molybdopterin-guanine dinucleotide biosynthesis protein B [Undibacterium griseum]MBC3886455.1 molybdopterin-guanine dinucleotide biosynthesis protein B [Undibacterium griseum]